MTPTLRLTVIQPDVFPEDNRVRTVAGSLLRIGRQEDNDWVIRDNMRLISRHQCAIHFRDNVYVVEDLSTNGVYLNHKVQAIGRGNIHVLMDGDRLEFCGIVLVVSVINHTEPQDSFRSLLPQRGDGAPAMCDAGVPASLAALLPQPAASGSGTDLCAPRFTLANPLPAHFPTGVFALRPLPETSSPNLASLGHPGLFTLLGGASQLDSNLLSPALGSPMGRGSDTVPVPDLPGETGCSRAEHHALQSPLRGQPQIPQDWDREAMTAESAPPVAVTRSTLP